ncbi:MAG: PaaI family thioesterase [Gaiellales bacterium]
MTTWGTEIMKAEWQPGDELPSHNEHCSICGALSTTSPLLTPFHALENEHVGTRVRFDNRHQGAPSYAHGGAVAAVLDDAMGYVSFMVLRLYVTAHLEVDYRRPVLLGEEYDVVAWCEQIDGRKVHLAAELRSGSDVIAEARGMFLTVDIEHFRP